MNFLIIGARGQLGQEWCRYLSKGGFKYTALDSTELDITKQEQIYQAISDYEPNILINCAAYTQVDNAEDEYETAELINGKAVGVLAKVCAEKGIKVVHYSTDYVFDGSISDQKKYCNGYPEDASTNPVNLYGKSKLSGEQLLKESGCEYLLLRVSWLCGIHGNNFVKTMLRLSENNQELNVVDDQFGAPTFCFDVVDETMELLKIKAKGIFHLSSKGIISWYEFASKIFEITPKKIQVNPISSHHFKTKAKRPAFSKLDPSKFEQTTGRSVIDWEIGLDKLISQL